MTADNAKMTPRKVVPVEFTYMDFTGETPTEKTETRHIYFTMGAVSKMLEELGVPKEQAKIAAEADSEEEAEEKLDNILEEAELEVSQQQGAIIIVWAGLQAESNQRGETLTVEQVGQMIEMDRMDEIMGAVDEAFAYYQMGEDAEMKDQEQEGGDQEAGETYETTGKKPPEEVGSPR